MLGLQFQYKYNSIRRQALLLKKGSKPVPVWYIHRNSLGQLYAENPYDDTTIDLTPEHAQFNKRDSKQVNLQHKLIRKRKQAKDLAKKFVQIFPTEHEKENPMAAPLVQARAKAIVKEIGETVKHDNYRIVHSKHNVKPGELIVSVRLEVPAQEPVDTSDSEINQFMEEQYL
jgi:hypothetical protein